ncbi:tRNA-dihydrouridine(20) synthase [NAD(P)+]-like [Panonychus citri]|uniref:tRNA-dihydrouridine(20) synthase [NAD(P)+]-like n=1 Tax=Panonychus citri TaxID=50023 RepID=UPI0023077463|nr:tRNA-dihydrouridine(20) synthase [NAD(P)+]-like [Panonychus citri]
MTKKIFNNYCDKIILAPMVRINTLPMRLLALDYGADLVYSEEIIDHKLIKCKRIVNDALGTIDYLDAEDKVAFRTCDIERDKVIVQIGTADPERALKAAKLVEQDVSGIDINMGCPKGFSIKGGMGAALLKKPETVYQILTTLTSNLSIPVTCKIRCLSSLENTLELVKIIQSTGVSAIGVHGRTKDERPQHKNRNDFIREISRYLSIPVIANGGSGDIKCYDDIEVFRRQTEASSVMLARAPESNCSIFRKDGLLSMDEVISDYLKYSIEYDTNINAVKYGVQHMMGSYQATPRGKACLRSISVREICNLWDLSDYYDEYNKDSISPSNSAES